MTARGGDGQPSWQTVNKTAAIISRFRDFASWCCFGVGVPALAGLAGAVLVAASPGGPVQPVGPVPPGRRDDGAAQERQQLRDGDRDQSGIQV
jgi:hypothetical protein